MVKIYKIRGMINKKNKDWRRYFNAPFRCYGEAILTDEGHHVAYIENAALVCMVCMMLNGYNVTWSGELQGASKWQGAKYYATEQEVRDDNGDTLCDIRGYSWMRWMYGLSSAEADAIVDAFGEEVAKIIKKLGK